MVFDAPESGLYRYAQSGLELARRDILRSAAVGAKRTWRTSSHGLWVHGLVDSACKNRPTGQLILLSGKLPTHLSSPLRKNIPVLF
jgi:hypothetical protein